MTRPKFSMTFNLGHLLQIGSLVIAITVGWMTLEARTAQNARHAEQNTKDVADLRRGLENTVGRVRSVETSTARADERLQSIFALLARIDARLERIEEK